MDQGDLPQPSLGRIEAVEEVQPPLWAGRGHSEREHAAAAGAAAAEVGLQPRRLPPARAEVQASCRAALCCGLCGLSASERTRRRSCCCCCFCSSWGLNALRGSSGCFQGRREMIGTLGANICLPGDVSSPV